MSDPQHYILFKKEWQPEDAPRINTSFAHLTPAVPDGSNTEETETFKESRLWKLDRAADLAYQAVHLISRDNLIHGLNVFTEDNRQLEKEPHHVYHTPHDLLDVAAYIIESQPGKVVQGNGYGMKQAFHAGIDKENPRLVEAVLTHARDVLDHGDIFKLASSESPALNDLKSQLVTPEAEPAPETPTPQTTSTMTL